MKTKEKEKAPLLPKDDKKVIIDSLKTALHNLFCPSSDLSANLVNLAKWGGLGFLTILCGVISFPSTTIPVARLVLEEGFDRNATTIGGMFKGKGVWYDIPADVLALVLGIVALLGINPFNVNGIEDLRRKIFSLLKELLNACKKNGGRKGFLENNHANIEKQLFQLLLIPFAGAPIGSLTGIMVKYIFGDKCPEWLYIASREIGRLVVGIGIGGVVAGTIYDAFSYVLIKTPKNMYQCFCPSKDPKEQFAEFLGVLEKTMMLQTYGNDLNNAILFLLNAVCIIDINNKNLRQKVREGYFSSEEFKNKFMGNAIEVFKRKTKLKNFISCIEPILRTPYPYFQDSFPIKLTLKLAAYGLAVYLARCMKIQTEAGYSNVVSQKIFGFGGWFTYIILWGSAIDNFAFDGMCTIFHPIANIQEAWENLSLRNFIIKLVTYILAPCFGLAMAFVSLNSNKNSAPSLAWGIALSTFVINTLISIMGLEFLAKNYGLGTSVLRDVVHELFADLKEAFDEAFPQQTDKVSSVVAEFVKKEDDNDDLPEVIEDEGVNDGKQVIDTIRGTIQALQPGCCSTDKKVIKDLSFFERNPLEGKTKGNTSINADGYEPIGSSVEVETRCPCPICTIL